MKEPRRLLADGDTSELARSLLVAGRERRAPKSARGRVWAVLAGGATTASVASSAAAGASGTGAGASGAGAGASMSAKAGGAALGLTKAKLLAVGVVLVTGGGATLAAVEQPELPPAAVVAPLSAAAAPKRTKQEAPASAASREDPATAEPALDPTPEAKGGPPAEATARPEPNAVLATTTKRVAVGGARTGPRTTPDSSAATIPGESAASVPGALPVPMAVDVSNLREEAALLNEVRAALAQQDVTGARSKLEGARRRFPRSLLAEERDALEVRLAIVSGDRILGRSLARAFVERYPDSPLKSGIEAIASRPKNE